MTMARTKKGLKDQADRAILGVVANRETGAVVAWSKDQNQQVEFQACQEQSIDKFDMAIRELAYLKWEVAGFPAGDGFDFWLEAEREVKAKQPVSGSAPE
jgi:hypothetical protein